MLAWGEWAARDPAEALGAAAPSARTLALLGNSLLLSSTVALIAVALGTGLAFWVYGGGGPWRRWARRLYLIPLLIPPYIHALAWLSVAGRRQPLERLLGLIFGPDRLQVPSYGFWPAALVLSLALAPIVTTLALAGLESLEPELMEQASLLRAPWPAARSVLLPLLAPWLVAGGGLVFVLSMVEYGVPSVFQFNGFVMEVYASFSQEGDPVRALATSTPLAACAVAVLVWSQGALRSRRMRGIPRRKYPLWMGSWPALPRGNVRVAVVAASLAAAAPVAILLARAGGPSVYGVALGQAWGEAGRTLATAVLAATGATLVAVPAALAVVGRERRRPLLWLLCAFPLAVPSPLTGIALVHLGNQPWLDWSQATLLPLAWAHMARLLPFALFAASTQVRRLDPLLLDALALHGVGLWRAFWSVRLPLLAPALWTSWLVVFVLSLGELGATLLVVPPGQATLPLRIYNLMHYGASETVAALSLGIMGLAAAVAALAYLLGRRLWPWTL